MKQVPLIGAKINVQLVTYQQDVPTVRVFKTQSPFRKSKIKFATT